MGRLRWQGLLVLTQAKVSGRLLGLGAEGMAAVKCEVSGRSERGMSCHGGTGVSEGRDHCVGRNRPLARSVLAARYCGQVVMIQDSATSNGNVSDNRWEWGCHC